MRPTLPVALPHRGAALPCWLPRRNALPVALPCWPRTALPCLRVALLAAAPPCPARAPPCPARTPPCWPQRRPLQPARRPLQPARRTAGRVPPLSSPRAAVPALAPPCSLPARRPASHVPPFPAHAPLCPACVLPCWQPPCPALPACRPADRHPALP
ncbi:unnamed protein product [Closterium sp. NIES-54]